MPIIVLGSYRSLKLETMALNVKFLEFSQNQFAFGINNSCKFDSSTRVQCNQAYFMKEIRFFQLSFMRYLT